MGQHSLLNNFTGGEISPLLDARVDLAKYGTSCRTLENMRPMVHGGAAFRASTLFLGKAKFGNKPCVLIPFNFNTLTTYVLELGDLYMRFYTGIGTQVATTTGTAPLWSYSAGYTPGLFAQFQGVIYVNILAVTATTPPAGNVTPDLDPTHWTAQTPLEISTPWTAAEVFQVQFKEINDVVYMVHPNHLPQKLTRVSAISFTLAAVAWKYPPLTDENLDGTTKMTVGALTGATTLTCSANHFNAAMVDAYFEVRHLRDASSVQVDMSASAGTVTSSAIEVVGDWIVSTTERWYGTLQIQRSTDGGSTWKVARQFTVKSDRNVSVSGSENAAAAGLPRIQLRLVYTAAGDPYGAPPWVGTVPTSFIKATATLEVADAYIAGLVKCTGFVSATVMNVTVVNKMWATTASDLWSESEFNGSRGYPRAVGVYEQRVFYAGTTTKPTTCWGSVAGDFENFQYSDLDDGAVAYQPAAAQQNPVQWLGALQQLAVGTAGEELKLGSGNVDEALTPSNVTIRTTSNIGSEPVMPLTVGKGILFLQRLGKRLREYVETNPYSPNAVPDPTDLSILAEHITGQGVVQMDYCRLPDAQIYAVLANGQLGVMAYSKEQNVNAWARYVTPGSFESVATVYGNPADVVFVVVKRTINGSTVRHIEAFTAELADKQNGIYGMDAAMVVTQAPSKTVYVGSYLEGQTVAVVADGVAIGDAFTGVGCPVVTGGNITLANAASYIRLGMPYFGTLLPQKLDSVIANGTSQGRKRRISEVTVRLRDTLGLRYGNSKTPIGTATPLNFADDAVFRSATDPMDAAPPLFTGDMVLPWAGGNDFNGDLLMAQIQPFPMTILGIFGKSEVFGD